MVLDEKIVGVTPYEHDYPDSYFERPLTVFQKRLGHSMHLRLILQGYVTCERELTIGPKNWVDLHNKSHGEYWLFKEDQVVIDLVRLPPVSPAPATPVVASAKADPEKEFSIEGVTGRAKAAIVSVQGPQLSGSGFFVSDSGLIATNAHLAASQTNLRVTLSTGQQLAASLVYQNSHTDVALLSVQAPAAGFAFPYLLLADPASVIQGTDVIAIGYPAAGMRLSVTRGIISQIGNLAANDDLTWLQTDAALNAGNSGGPLLNLRGEVVGMTTEKPSATSVSGIGFALSSIHLSAALRDYLPLQPAPLEKLAAPTASEPGEIDFQGPEHATVFENGKSLGEIPLHLKLPPGEYTFAIRQPGVADCVRHIRLVSGAHATLSADCFPPP